MRDKAFDACPPALNFVPNWFVTNKFLEKLDDIVCYNDAVGCVYPTLYIIRLLRRVYHFSLLICYPSSLYFHAFMLVAFWE